MRAALAVATPRRDARSLPDDATRRNAEPEVVVWLERLKRVDVESAVAVTPQQCFQYIYDFARRRRFYNR